MKSAPLNNNNNIIINKCPSHIRTKPDSYARCSKNVSSRTHPMNLSNKIKNTRPAPCHTQQHGPQSKTGQSALSNNIELATVT